MKAAPFGLAAFAALAALPSAKAEDTVRACIAASTDGQTFRKQGKLLAAREQMIACARDACPPIVRSHCARWLSEVDAAIPSVVVRAADATGADAIGARLSIDGRPGKLDGQPVRLDPGEHTVAIENETGARKEERVLLVEGESARLVALRFPSPSPTPTRGALSQEPPPRGEISTASRRVPAGAWVLGGVGVVALGGALYFGLTANSDLNSLKATCSPHCAESQTQPGRTDAAVFDVLLGTGAAALVGALVWGLAFPSHPARSASAPRFELRPLAGGAFTALTFSY
jgi:hypothetical protein